MANAYLPLEESSGKDMPIIEYDVNAPSFLKVKKESQTLFVSMTAPRPLHMVSQDATPFQIYVAPAVI